MMNRLVAELGEEAEALQTTMEADRQTIRLMGKRMEVEGYKHAPPPLAAAKGGSQWRRN